MKILACLFLQLSAGDVTAILTANVSGTVPLMLRRAKGLQGGRVVSEIRHINLANH